LLFVAFTIYHHTDPLISFENLCKALYYIFLAFEVFILWAWAANNSGSAIRDEVANKSYDFFRMLPLTAAQKTIGILIGKNLVALLIAIINCPFLLFFGIKGNVNLNLQSQLILVLLSTMVLANSFALLASIVKPERKHKKIGLVTSIIMVLWLLPIMGHGMVSLFKAKALEKVTEKFFQADIPVLILITLVASYLSCWIVKGIMRKFDKEHQPLFSIKGAFIFLLGCEFIIIGLFYAHLLENSEVIKLFWLASFIPLVLIPLGLLRSFDDYLEYAGLMKENINSANNISSVLRRSNLLPGLGLFALWVLIAIWITIFDDGLFRHSFSYIAVLFSFFALYILLLEISAVFYPKYPNIKLLVITILVIYMVFPLIYSAATQSDIIHRFSPLGYFFHIFDSEAGEFAIDIDVLLVNLLLCTLVAFPVYNRYCYAVNARKDM
jgi:hypothetical protein